MVIVMYIISILWIAWGSFLIIDTRPAREFWGKLFFRENIRLFGIVPFIFGLILVVGAFYSGKMFWLALILGLLALLKGVYLFIGRQPQIMNLLEWWSSRASDGTIRLFGLITFILGCALLSYLI